MYTRRRFLGETSKPVAAAMLATSVRPDALSRLLEAFTSFKGSPAEAAEEEDLWREVQQAFPVDRSMVNLNNGGVSPSPTIVLEAMKRRLDFSNEAPVYTMWQVLEPQREGVRNQLARAFGCDPEELALVRNASEGLQTCQFGLQLERGDEVLTTTHDYPRMITTFKQRERRDGIRLVQFPLPIPAEDPDAIVRLFETHITPRTRMILLCHMVNITGQILPVKQIVAMARKRGIPAVVDGAHSLAHLTFSLKDLDCDYYSASLHKWLFAPHGTGMLYVRKEKISDLWPLMAAPEEMRSNIRKFEEIGTHPAAPYLAIAEALTFNLGIGFERKEQRMRYLTRYWTTPLLAHDRIRLHTSLRPECSCGIATVQVDGVDSAALAEYLFRRHRIIVVAIQHPEFEGIRVTPSVYTTLHDLDRFIDAMQTVVRDGIP